MIQVCKILDREGTSYVTVIKTLDRVKLYTRHFMLQVCETLNIVQLYTRHFTCYGYDRP